MTTTYEKKPGVDSTGKGAALRDSGGRKAPAATGETAAQEHNATEGEGFTDSVTGERITLAVLLAAWE